MSRRAIGIAGIVALAGCVAAGEPPAGEQRRAIIGGAAAKGAHPAVVAIATVSGATLDLHCTGVLITRDVVLTAAHCLGPDLADLRITLGDDLGGASRVVAVSGQTEHPLWLGVGNPLPGVGQSNDIALLELAEEIAGVPPLPIIRTAEVANAVKVGQPLTLVGYGSQLVGGPLGEKRVAGGVAIEQVGNFELRIGNPGQPQACDGDSGGPALVDVDPGSASDWRLVGLVSRAVGETCDQGVLYTRVDAYTDFIQQQALLPCGSGGRPACGDGGAAGDGGASGDGAATSDGGGVVIGGGIGGGQPRPIANEGGCRISPLPRDQTTPLVLIAALLLAARRRRPRPG